MMPRLTARDDQCECGVVACHLLKREDTLSSFITDVFSLCIRDGRAFQKVDRAFRLFVRVIRREHHVLGADRTQS